MAEKEQTAWERVNWTSNKCIFSVLSFPLLSPDRPVLKIIFLEFSLLTPRAPEMFPELNGFAFRAPAKSLSLAAQPISSQATQQQLQQQKASTLIITSPCDAPVG